MCYDILYLCQQTLLSSKHSGFRQTVLHYRCGVITALWYHIQSQKRQSHEAERSVHYMFWKQRTLSCMQAVSRDVPWQAHIGAVKSWAQSSSSGHTFLPYLFSKLDLLFLLSVVRNSLSEGLFLAPSLSFLLACSDSLARPLSTPTPPTPFPPTLPVPSLKQWSWHRAETVNGH